VDTVNRLHQYCAAQNADQPGPEGYEQLWPQTEDEIIADQGGIASTSLLRCYNCD